MEGGKGCGSGPSIFLSLQREITAGYAKGSDKVSVSVWVCIWGVCGCVGDAAAGVFGEKNA